jgi:hypothetical protein
MKKIIIVMAALVMLAACSTTKTASTASAPAKITPAGEWDYSIKETPEGDFTGLLSVTEQDKTFSAKMNANGYDMAFEKFNWDEANKAATGEFYYSGMSVFFSAKLEGEEMKGTVSAGGMEFPFLATRKK